MKKQWFSLAPIALAIVILCSSCSIRLPLDVSSPSETDATAEETTIIDTTDALSSEGEVSLLPSSPPSSANAPSSSKAATPPSSKAPASSNAPSSTAPIAEEPTSAPVREKIKVDVKPLPPMDHIDDLSITVAVYGLDQKPILSGASAWFETSSTVFDATMYILNWKDISYQYSGNGLTAYMQKIGELGEFEHGPGSGWIYSINRDRTRSTNGAGVTKLQKGDVIEWFYTTNNGKDLPF